MWRNVAKACDVPRQESPFPPKRMEEKRLVVGAWRWTEVCKVLDRFVFKQLLCSLCAKCQPDANEHC